MPKTNEILIIGVDFSELGDIAWYLDISADAIGYDLETIFQMNINKLKDRYPDRFDSRA